MAPIAASVSVRALSPVGDAEGILEDALSNSHASSTEEGEQAARRYVD